MPLDGGMDLCARAARTPWQPDYAGVLFFRSIMFSLVINLLLHILLLFIYLQIDSTAIGFTAETVLTKLYNSVVSVDKITLY
jgi:hypothetical protein